MGGVELLDMDGVRKTGGEIQGSVQQEVWEGLEHAAPVTVREQQGEAKDAHVRGDGAGSVEDGNESNGVCGTMPTTRYSTGGIC